MRISDWSSDVCSSDLLFGMIVGEVWHDHELHGRSFFQKSDHLDTAVDIGFGHFRFDQAVRHRSEISQRLLTAVFLAVFLLMRIAGNPDLPARPRGGSAQLLEIGRASCRERVCQYV